MLFFIGEPNFIASYQSKADFLGMANHRFRKALTSYTPLPFCSTHLAYFKSYLRVKAVLLHSSDTCHASVVFLQHE